MAHPGLFSLLELVVQGEAGSDKAFSQYQEPVIESEREQQHFRATDL